MGILGKGVATTVPTHIYTVPENKRSIVLINATNTNDSIVKATISIRENVDYEVGGIVIDDEGSTYEIKPDIKFSIGNAEAEVDSLNIKSFNFTGTETGYNIGDVLISSNASNKDAQDTNCVITVTSVQAGTGKIVSYIFTNNGRYANTIPEGDAITFTGGTGVGARINVSTLLYGINTVSVTNPGDDYTTTPTITTVDPFDGETVIGNGNLIVQMVSDAIRKYDAIEYEAVIPVGSALERSAIVLNAGDSIYVNCDIADTLNVMVFGVEEIA